MLPGIQGTATFKAPDSTAGIRVNAKNAVTALIAITKAFLVFSPRRAIKGTNTLEISGRMQTSQMEMSVNCISFSLLFCFLFFYHFAYVTCAIPFGCNHKQC